MDQRTTFENAQKLLSTLLDLKGKENVALLLHIEGLTRLQGKIVNIEEQQPLEKTLIILNDETFLLEQVIAVNGIFRSDYSEC